MDFPECSPATARGAATHLEPEAVVIRLHLIPVPDARTVGLRERRTRSRPTSAPATDTPPRPPAA